MVMLSQVLVNVVCLQSAAVAETCDHDVTSALQKNSQVVRHGVAAEGVSQVDRVFQAIRNTASDAEFICLSAQAGEEAPFPGTFTPILGHQVEVDVGHVASESGKYCVQNSLVSLMQRATTDGQVKNFEAVVADKGAEGSTSGKNKNKNKKKETTTTTTKSSGQCTDLIEGYDELFHNGNSGECKRFNPAKTLNPGVCWMGEANTTADYKIWHSDGSWECPLDGQTSEMAKKFASPQDCAAECTLDNTCKGIEWIAGKGCKMWLTPPHFSVYKENSASRCFVRSSVELMSPEIGTGDKFGSAQKQVPGKIWDDSLTLNIADPPKKNPGNVVTNYEELLMGGPKGLSGSCRHIDTTGALNIGACCTGTEMKEQLFATVELEEMAENETCASATLGSYNFIALNTFKADKNGTCQETPEMMAKFFQASTAAECGELCDADPECNAFELALEDNGWGACELWRGPILPSFAENRPTKDLWCYVKTSKLENPKAVGVCPAPSPLPGAEAGDGAEAR